MSSGKLRTLVMAFVFVCLFSICALAGEVTLVNIRFGQTASNGTFKNSYSKWNAQVEPGDKLQLPVIHGDGSYLWEGKMDGKVIREAEGSIIKITGKANFSLIRTYKCTITYRQQSGDAYKSLKKVVPATTLYKLPELENYDDLKFLGWSREKGSSEKIFEAGKKIRAADNITYYAVYQKRKVRDDLIYLYFSNGTLYQTLERTASVRFPSPDLGSGKTLIGWDTKKNKTCNPLYVEDAKIPTSSSVYYMVISERKKEPAFSASMLKSPRRYERIYLMGDSRLAFAKRQFGTTPKKVTFVASAGSGYRWLIGLDPTRRGGAWLRILGYLKDRKAAGILKGRSAVISEFGVNDLENIDRYILFYKRIAAVLKKYRCDLYVMSVNPFHRGRCEYWLKTTGGGINTRTMPKIMAFNKKLRSGAGSAYTYIDTFSYLLKTGWSSMDPETRKGDGLHYSVYTGAKMVNFAITAADNHYAKALSSK